MAFYHLILRNGCGAHHARTSCLGFSGVLFGLHTVAWLQLGAGEAGCRAVQCMARNWRAARGCRCIGELAGAVCVRHAYLCCRAPQSSIRLSHLATPRAGGTPPLQSLISASILIPQARCLFLGRPAAVVGTGSNVSLQAPLSHAPPLMQRARCPPTAVPPALPSSSACSFVGHSAGILAGALVAILRLNLWVSPTLSFALAAAALAYTCAACPDISLSLPACFPDCVAGLWRGSGPQIVGGCLYRSAPPSADSWHAAATGDGQDSAAPVPCDEARAAAAAAAEARHAQRAAAHKASALRLAGFQAQRDTRLCAPARRPQLVGGRLYSSAPPSADNGHSSAAPVPRDEARAVAAAAAEARQAQPAAAHQASSQRLAAFQAQRDTRFSADPSTPPNDSTARILRYRGASPPSPA